MPLTSSAATSAAFNPIVRLWPPDDASKPSHALCRREGLLRAEQALQVTSPLPLMDLAGAATARLAMAIAPHAQRIWVLAGPGNNGGDGLEAALQLHLAGQAVRVWCPAPDAQRPADAQRAFKRAQAAGVPIQPGLPPSADLLSDQDLCIDALLGMGAQRPPEGTVLMAIHWLKNCPAQVLAVDVPSGLHIDSGQALGRPEQIVRADHTLTMIAAKPGLFMGQGRDTSGTLWLAPLQTARDTRTETADAHINATSQARPRLHASHKGSHGDVAVIGGESVSLRGMGMRGAAWLAASAALHAGAGRTLLVLPDTALHDDNVLPDVMLRRLDALALPQLTVVAGCGGGRSIVPQLGALLQHSARLVLDADALNAVAADPWLQTLLQERAQQQRATVMTPHPLEAARLLGCSTADVQADRLSAAQALAERHQATVALKGSGTVIAQAGQAPRINPTGNGRLAIGGTGDVLTGFIAGVWAQGLDAWSATCTAVWRHGQLADEWPKDTPLTASALARHWH